MGFVTHRNSGVSSSALGRSIGHVMLLAAIGLAVAVASFLPLAVNAQAGSAGAAIDGGPVPADVQLHVGETAALDGGAVQVTFTQVAEDSRCPKDVLCVWAGRALVELHVWVDGADKGLVTASLMPGSPPSQELDATVERYVFSLTDLQPYPQASQPQPLDQRVATLHVRPWTP
jgi:hypothetical protein